MAVPSVEPGLPRPLEQLMALPPLARIVAGAVMLTMGGTGIWLSTSFYAIVLVGVSVALGLPLLVLGLSDRRAGRLEAAERARAEAELPALRAVVATAVQDRQNVARVLRQRGYTNAAVRRWIALECGVVLAGGAGPQR